MGYGTSGDAAPVHNVTLSRDFYCAVLPTTRAQHLLIRGKNTYGDYWPNGEGLDANGDPFDYYPVSKDVSYNEIRGSAWPDADGVTAGTVIGRLRARTALQFDIPTEAQWEYACRAGHSGNSYNDGSAYGNDTAANAGNGYAPLGWGQANSGWSGSDKDNHWHPVAKLKPSDWDFYDFYGNVLEWCRDWYAAYTADAVTDPVGPTTGTARVSRGGSYALNASVLNSYARRNKISMTTHDNNSGYRLVVETDEGDAATTAQGVQRGFADSAAGLLETRPGATLAGIRANWEYSIIDTDTPLAFVLIVR
jgi:formylglycine-generating enzyme required for sulfatase activity